jgi:hypothetical protein
MNTPNFISHDRSFRILSVKPCTEKFLFHGSAKKLDIIDPAYNRSISTEHEYGIPVIFASKEPSNAFCYKPTIFYKELRDSRGISVYHRLFSQNHKILLGAELYGYIYVVSGKDFYEITREDFEVGEWVVSIEYISIVPVTPIESITIEKPYDWEMIPDYEFLGEAYVGEMSAEKYLSLATDPVVKEAIRQCIAKPFVSTIPDALQKYLS